MKSICNSRVKVLLIKININNQFKYSNSSIVMQIRYAICFKMAPYVASCMSNIKTLSHYLTKKKLKRVSITLLVTCHTCTIQSFRKSTFLCRFCQWKIRVNHNKKVCKFLISMDNQRHQISTSLHGLDSMKFQQMKTTSSHRIGSLIGICMIALSLNQKLSFLLVK